MEVVIANPIPETDAMDFEVISTAIDNAVIESEELGIKGKDTTPFLLDKVKKITEGKSLDANIALVYNNVKFTTEIAKNSIRYNKKRRSLFF